jgi:hypothetical protein
VQDRPIIIEEGDETSEKELEENNLILCGKPQRGTNE